ncbi:MAG: hypothetical protein JO218_02015 [Burkholderiales bacterium]|nr:hypothetical protein [Burkholderiales bacterium]
MRLDYNTLLVVALWLLFFSNFIVLLKPGEGLLFLGRQGASVYVPSWRAAFGGRLLVWFNPLRSLTPVTRLQVFGAQDAGTLGQLAEGEARIATLLDRLGPLALGAAISIAWFLPAALLRHWGPGYLLGSLLLAYGLHLAVLLLGWRQHKREPLPAGSGAIGLEALCCLPYAAQLPRRISFLALPSISLAELLASDRAIVAADLAPLRERIADYRAVVDEPQQAVLLDTLTALIDQRIAKETAA